MEKLNLSVGDKLYLVEENGRGVITKEDYPSILKVGSKFFYILVSGQETKIPLTITLPYYGLSHSHSIFLTKEDWEERNFRREFNWKVKNKNFNDIPLEKLKEAARVLGLWQA
jgi:hypothetical protein